MAVRLAVGEISAAVLVWFVALWGFLLELEPFRGWFYHFMWWPLIFFLDGVLTRLEGRSRIWSDFPAFLRLAGFSVSFWLLFEAMNLYLLNWRYVGLEPRLWLRWPGYVLAFATVLPGMLWTAAVLSGAGVGAGVEGRPLAVPAWRPLWLVLGLICLVLPVLAPSWAFPLIWLSVFFLLDPLMDLLTGDSLSRRFLAGERQQVVTLGLAGLLCGLWWELWNYPSPARWIYTLPVLNFGKIFEMPVLGYLGFIPFALEGAVMYNVWQYLERQVLTSPTRRRWAWLIQVWWWLLMFLLLDSRTVISFR
jgi:hypothetical protein